MEQGRVDQFKAEVSSLKIRTQDARRDGVLQIVGIVLMVLGIVVVLVTYESSRNMSDPRDIQSQIILAIGFLAVTGAGGALFLYASLAKFLRFWLLRQVYESRSQVDQVVAAFQPRPEPEPAPAAPASAAVEPAAGAQPQVGASAGLG
ncbi:hypothetical protein [Frankia nepalensis]|uniref:hypothetical protein n=1 Tax=Frankia nepalensis TaxID=1836974 RepID=UPI001EE485F2|nr:hypothetical protein [Frankia nepalensis]